MSAAEVAGYVNIINSVLAPEGLVYELNNGIATLVLNSFRGGVLNINGGENLWSFDRTLLSGFADTIQRSGMRPWARSALYSSQVWTEWFSFAA